MSQRHRIERKRERLAGRETKPRGTEEESDALRQSKTRENRRKRKPERNT